MKRPTLALPQIQSKTARLRGTREPSILLISEALEDLYEGNRRLLNAVNDISEDLGKVLTGATPTVTPGGIDLLIFRQLIITPTVLSDFGRQNLAVRAIYSSTNADGLSGIVLHLEYLDEPSAPIESTNCGIVPYGTQGGGLYVASRIMTPPANERPVRAYLTRVYNDGSAETLKTVSMYGEENASAHLEGVLDPIPTDQRGVEYADNVTGFNVTYRDGYDSNGSYFAGVDIAFTAPADPRWGGVEIDVRIPIIGIPGSGYVQLIRVTEPTDGVPLPMIPPAVQTWEFFARSFNTMGQPNTLNEDPEEGELTPKDSVQIGSALGTQHAGKLALSTLADYLQIANEVLGIKPLGIDNSLIDEFAIAELNLMDVPMIGASRIHDLGVTNAKIANLAAGKLLAGVLVVGVQYSGTITAGQLTAGTALVGDDGLTVTGQFRVNGSSYFSNIAWNNKVFDYGDALAQSDYKWVLYHSSGIGFFTQCKSPEFYAKTPSDFLIAGSNGFLYSADGTTANRSYLYSLTLDQGDAWVPSDTSGTSTVAALETIVNALKQAIRDAGVVIGVTASSRSINVRNGITTYLPAA